MRVWIITGVLLVTAACVALWVMLGVQTQRPAGVVIVTLEMVRTDRLAAYGGSLDRTPHLDQLAKDAVVFEHASTPATHSAAAHASVFTGLRPENHQLIDNSHPLPADVVTLAERMRGAGLETGAFVSSLLVGADLGLAKGFQTFAVHIQPDHRHEAGPVSLDKALATFDAAAEWIGKRDPAGPGFLVWIHAQNAHFDFDPPQEFAPALPPPPDTPACIRTFNTAFRRGEPLREDQIAYTLAKYDAEVAVVDAGLGRVFGALEAQGFDRDNTVLVVLSDHGVSLFERRDHRLARVVEHVDMHFEEIVRVPLLIRAPGIDPVHVGGFVEITSVHETVAELARLPRLTGERAPSLVRAMRTGSAPATFPLTVWPPSNKGFAVREGDYKLIVDLDGRHLYDVASDPAERTDLAATDPERAEALFKKGLPLRGRWREIKQERAPQHEAVRARLMQSLREGGYLE